MPLAYLGLSDTKFTDHGFKYLMQRFEAIYLRNLSMHQQSSRGVVTAMGGDVEGMMEIDLSRNNITEASIKYLADILRKFQGFKAISLSGLSKMNQAGFVELARSLKENHSLQRLNISKNSLSQSTIAEFFTCLQDNFVLTELSLDVKHKTMPFGPSHTFNT